MNHKLLGLSAALLLALVAGAPAVAQHAASGHAPHAQGHAPGKGIANSGKMIDGEVRKVDAAAKKVTIHHGEIKDMGMPPMTMVFQVRDPAVLAKAKEGDKVRFRSETHDGAMVLVALEPAK